MAFILPFIYALIFIFIIYKLRFFDVDGLSRKTLSLLFMLKVVFGIFLALIYTYYYKSKDDADTFIYFTDGEIIFRSIYKNPLDYIRMLTGIGSDASHLDSYYSSTGFWNKTFNYNLYNDNRILIRFNALVHLFSFGHYYVHTVFMAFISFAGLTAIYKAFVPFLKEKKIMLTFAVFLFPSVLLWTSGLLKEGILMFAFGILIYNLFKIIYEKFTVINGIGLMCGLFLLMVSKFYILLAALPGMISIFWIVKSGGKKVLVKFAMVHLIFFLVFAFSKYLLPGYNMVSILSMKQNDFINMSKEIAHAGSYYQIPKLEPSITSILLNSPRAFFNTLVRPSVLDIKSPIMLFSAIENLFICFSIIICLFYSNFRNVSCKPLLLFSISFVVITFTLCGLTTPVFGSLVRYKTPALPFLFIFLIFITDSQSLKKAIRRIIKSDT